MRHIGQECDEIRLLVGSGLTEGGLELHPRGLFADAQFFRDEIGGVLLAQFDNQPGLGAGQTEGRTEDFACVSVS